MYKTFLSNVELEALITTIANVENKNEDINGLTSLKIMRIKETIHDIYKPFHEKRKDLINKYGVKKEEEDKFVIENGDIKFDTEEHKQAVRELDLDMNEVQLPKILTENDLENLILSRGQIYTLQLVTESGLREEEPEQVEKDEIIEEQVDKDIEHKDEEE